MVNYSMIRLNLAILFLITISTFAESSILCIGDSITEGGKSFKVYRFPLNDLLKKAGFKYRFVGSKENAEEGVSLKHDGYGGKNTQFLKENIEKIYKANPADFVLLHAGHNNFARDKPVARIISDTKEIIKEIQKINPRAVILLAQVIPSGKLPKYSYIPELNRQLSRLSIEPYIMTVNIAKGFDWQTDTVADKVHPNKKGAEKMAAAWFEALSAFPEKFE